MRTRFLTKECGNLDEWQNFVDSVALGNIFQTRNWAEAMSEAGRKSLLLVVEDGRGNIKGGLLSSYNVYSFLGLDIIPSISAIGGPVVYDLHDSELLEMIFGAFDAKAKKLGAFHSFIRSSFPLNGVLVKHFDYKIEHNRLPCTVIVDLTKPIEELWKNMHKNTRWGTRKAEKAGVTIQEGKSLHEIFAYYRIHVQTCIRLNIPSVSFLTFKSVWNTFSPENNIKVFLANYRGKPIAGNIVLRWRDKTWAWHGASLEEYWRLHANQLLEWSSIKWAAKNGARTYDLLGIPCKKDEQHPKYGLYQYKIQFGGKIVRQGEYMKHYFPLKSAFFKSLLRIYGRFSHSVPMHKSLLVLRQLTHHRT